VLHSAFELIDMTKKTILLKLEQNLIVFIKSGCKYSSNIAEV